ncbi:hypothetical protein EJB10_00615 [Wolbachia endosymbiont of Brugia malayi]|uniref:hypothetical protein n=1 Tax=Wolbachia endosymbiont of Brugia malayi TaxID=80849 RepID=UPI00004C9467|nr:hypothetical protein [Wolbachia endosymbiont of Brugia malayi]AAW71191.1 Predicted protein [Wolbachia endosymbiont strain TRS of Brugia malayi]QCB61389.1 hypothetical protein EJB10_00615 [Wolbachia endosymbiont of Brugia malayi]
MTVNILENDSFIKANEKGYKDSDRGFWSTTKGIADANWQYVCHHPYKTAVVILGTLSVVALTAAYFLSPAYTAFIGVAGAKIATLVNPAITGLPALAVAHPLVTGLIVAASVVALIAAPIYAWMNSSKASQIEKVRELLKDEKPASKIGELKEIFKISTEEEKTPA